MSSSFSVPARHSRIFDISTLRTPLHVTARHDDDLDEDAAEIFAFGKSYHEFKSTIECITVNSSFLTDAHVVDILKKDRRRINSLVDYEKPEQGFVYGLLGSTVDALWNTTRQKHNNNNNNPTTTQNNTESSSSLVLLTILDRDDETVEPRIQLTNFLMLLAELADPPPPLVPLSYDAIEDSSHRRELIKYFVRYLMDTLFSILKREKKKELYDSLVESLQIATTSLTDTTNVSRTLLPFKCEVTKKAIAAIIGNNSMDGTVGLAWNCMQARFTKVGNKLPLPRHTTFYQIVCILFASIGRRIISMKKAPPPRTTTMVVPISPRRLLV